MGTSIPQPFEPQPQAAGLVNPFRDRLLLIDTIDRSAELISTVVPLRQLEAASTSVPWWHYGFESSFGGVALVAAILPACHLQTQEHDGLTVLLGYGGEQRIRQESYDWTCQADDCLILNGASYSCDTTAVSTLLFHLRPERLLSTAMVMKGLQHGPAAWKDLIQQSQCRRLSADRDGPPLQALLRQEISLVNQLVDASPALIERLQVDERIYRLMAAMILPDLLQDSPLDRLHQKDLQGRDIFDEMIDYIKHNLAEPLNLTMLESYSHYSRRALQYAFKERLGCTATQWIRNQRLDQARRFLQNPSPGDSVAQIATQCGYRSLSLFSVDFQQRFHVKPSQLLREARATRPPQSR
ncbi:AraC family transcriptional regulator [Synechococcus sp. CS-1328]|uniref:helix-turn-helix transcriptional regulator n=1 Tax=Synechococcus sp. CS-1328 TaxID=2847976 RepID=UPI00223C08DA|nr:AraC family transcriptional regulator [Synechococcus sp. CS-1328]MCT0225951.1 AraC family transcriptional regulator [Synechococcus sp. CS-1328]